jgi:hypothetical protein
MDKQTFDDLAAQTRLGERALKMAEDYLCNGMKASQIAKREGVSGKLVYQAVNRIVRQQRLINHYPENWITVTVTLPKIWAQLVIYIQTLEHVKAGLLAKSEPRLPEFELSDIAELSKLVESILVKWRKI